MALSYQQESESKADREPLLSSNINDAAGSGGSTLGGSTLIAPKHEDSHNSGFIHESVQHLNEYYPLWVAVVYILNYGIGPGVFALPYEFFDAGYVLAPVVLIWLTIVSYITYKHVCCLVWRAEAIVGICKERGMTKDDVLDHPDAIVSALCSSSPDADSTSAVSRIRSADLHARYKLFYKNEFELNQIIGIFCGRQWRLVYEVLYFFLQLTQLWSFVVLFATSMTRFIGIPGIADSCNVNDKNYSDACRSLYSFYCSVFWIWGVCMILLDFTQQMFIQLGVFAFRMVGLVYVFVTTIGLIWGNLKYDGADGTFNKVSSSPPHYGDDLEAFDFEGLFYFIMVAVFGFGSQFSVPDVIEPLHKPDRAKCNLIFGSSMLVYGLVFLLCGVVVSLYFGKDTEDPCTLAWLYFRGLEWTQDRPAWSYLIAWTVVLLPPLDVLTAYPLNAITFANTIEQSLLSEEQMLDSWWKVVIRVLVVSSSVALALIVWDYDAIASVSGLSVMFALYFLPALAELRSQHMCERIVGTHENEDEWVNLDERHESAIVTDDVVDDAMSKAPYTTPVSDWSSNKGWIYATLVTVYVSFVGLMVVALVEVAQ